MNSLGTIKAGLAGECPEARERAARIIAGLAQVKLRTSNAGATTECSGQNEWTQYTKSRNTVLRDQSEDRSPLYYHVVGFEHKDFGLVYYVQHPNGKRNSVYTTDYDLAWKWRDAQEEARLEYTQIQDELWPVCTYTGT